MILTIDKEFQELIPALTQEEYAGLNAVEQSYYRGEQYLLAKEYNNQKKKALKEKKESHRKIERGLLKSLRKELLKVYKSCYCCDFNITELLEFHHKTPIANFGKTTFENIVPLCPNCHAIVHCEMSGRGTKILGNHFNILVNIKHLEIAMEGRI